MKPIRICHFSTVHRGVEIRIVRKELASLAAAGYDAHAVIAATPEEVAEAAKLGVTIHPLQERPGAGRVSRMTRKMYDAWSQCRAVDAQLYHFHDPELIPLGLLLKLSGRKVVIDVHEDLANQILTKHWIPAPIRKVVSRLARGMERIAARRLDGTVVAASKLGPFFEDVARRLMVVHNYPLLSELASPPTEEEANLPLSELVKKLPPATHVAYVGGISRIRGIYEAVAAVEKADVGLVLAGTFKTKAERDQAAAMSGWPRVDELGWVARDGIRAALQRSFAGLCTLHPTPNHVSAEPIKLLEYMAAGIPSIVSDIPDWVEFVEKHDIGLCVDPMDVDAIAKAIVTLRDDPERRAQMGRNGQKAVMEQYNWNTQAKRLEALYEEILKS